MWVLCGIITQFEMSSNARVFGVRRRFIFGDELCVLRCKYLFLLVGVRKVLETKHFADFFIRRFSVSQQIKVPVSRTNTANYNLNF